ncbi:MAG: ComF family protein [Vicingaceae bacterium]|jgi:ComF family protein
MLKALFNLIYPKICYACGEAISGTINNVCISCRGDLAFLRIQDFQNNPIQQLFWGRVTFEKATAFAKFEKNGKIQKLLHALKYKGIKEVGITLGELAALEIGGSGFFNDIDMLVPVPIHAKKQKKRGYNQSHYIAEGIGNITELPIDLSSIKKELHTASQTRKRRFERFENVSNTFTLVNFEQLKGKHILLVDDVVTTGSTLEACANVLQKIEGVKLSLLTISATY